MEKIRHCEDLERLVTKIGFLPFFMNGIPDFSIEEATPRHLWFSDEEEGPWEWKGPVLRNVDCAYGKLFQKKAGFVSMEWFPELVNYRRAVYNLKEASPESMDRVVYETVREHESLLSKEIKALCGYSKKTAKRGAPLSAIWGSAELLSSDMDSEPRKEGYETVITRLQMGTWLVVADFEYRYTKQGDPYGWGIARYITPEALFGTERVLAASHHSPEESVKRLADYLTQLLPQATDRQILKIIG